MCKVEQHCQYDEQDFNGQDFGQEYFSSITRKVRANLYSCLKLLDTLGLLPYRSYL